MNDRRKIAAFVIDVTIGLLVAHVVRAIFGR
jgi:hypothetical protein